MLMMMVVVGGEAVDHDDCHYVLFGVLQVAQLLLRSDGSQGRKQPVSFWKIYTIEISSENK